MTRGRRGVLVAAMWIAAAAVTGAAEAAWQPEKTIEFIAPSGPGGGWDRTARGAQKVLTDEKLVSQPIVVNNVAGGSGAVALGQVMSKRKGDAHLLLAMSPALTFTLALGRAKDPATGKNLTYRDVTPIAAVATDYGAIVVKKDSPFKSLKDLLDAYKSNPASVSVAGGSAVGSQDHIKFAKLVKAAGMDATKVKYVPFQGGGEAMAALLGGHTAAAAPDISEIAGQIEAGQIRVLAVLSDGRLTGPFKDIPTAKEQGVNMNYILWRGFYAPPGLAKEQADYWRDTLGKMVKTASWKKLAADSGWFEFFRTGDEFAKFLDDDLESAAALLKELGLVK
ncbi:MAG: Bug family tripartite tricarboxylate transporter substrate binding protein [Candidatus Methylomirabilales bacterium]